MKKLERGRKRTNEDSAIFIRINGNNWILMATMQSITLISISILQFSMQLKLLVIEVIMKSKRFLTLVWPLIQTEILSLSPFSSLSLISTTTTTIVKVTNNSNVFHSSEHFLWEKLQLEWLPSNLVSLSRHCLRVFIYTKTAQRDWEMVRKRRRIFVTPKWQIDFGFGQFVHRWRETYGKVLTFSKVQCSECRESDRGSCSSCGVHLVAFGHLTTYNTERWRQRRRSVEVAWLQTSILKSLEFRLV